MAESKDKPPSPESTLVDQDDTSRTPMDGLPVLPVGKRPTNPDLPIANPDTAPMAIPLTHPDTSPTGLTVGKRPTRSALPAQHPAPTLPPEPPAHAPAPERNRASGKQREPVSDRVRISGKRAVPHEHKPPPELLEPPTSVTPLATAAPNNPLAAESTRLNALPNAAHAKLGPSGTLDADPNPAVKGPESTFTDDEGQPTDPHKPQLEARPPDSANRTHDFRPLSATKTFAGLDEVQFRRAVWGLALGALLLISLTFVWVMVKFDDAPTGPAPPSPIGGPPGTKAAPKPGPAPIVDALQPTMIERTVDAGAGETRVVMAAAGTVRIVTEPEANASVGGKELGVTPVLVTLPAGKNQVELENTKLGFKRTVTVDVVSNEQTAARFAFSKGWIELDADGAKVSIDGKPVTGTHIQVWEGTHRVDAEFDGKKKLRVSRSAVVTAGMTTSVHFDAPSVADDD